MKKQSSALGCATCAQAAAYTVTPGTSFNRNLGERQSCEKELWLV